MTLEEAKQFIDEKLSEGIEEDELLGFFCQMFVDGKIEIEELNKFCGLLGYELSEDFLSMNTEEQRKNLFEDDEDEEENKLNYEEMSLEDLKEFLSENGYVNLEDDSDIAKALYQMYSQEKLNYDDLNILLGKIEYGLTEQFEKMSFVNQQKLILNTKNALDGVIEIMYYWYIDEIITYDELEELLGVFNQKIDEQKLTYLLKKRYKNKKRGGN